MNQEKTPDAGLTMSYYGVSLNSRHGKRKEHDTMMDIVDDIVAKCPSILPEVVDISCDSKCTNNYYIQCSENIENGGLAMITKIAQKVLIRTNGGHNGFYVSNGSQEVVVDPDWNEP